MKGKLLFLSFMSCLQALAQQSIISGVVSVFNSETNTGKRQYVSNASVTAEFFKVQPAVTKDGGQFTLIYIGVEEKTSVSFQVIRPGLEVVNTDALDGITGQKTPIKISMAHKDSIAEYRKRIYNVGKSQAEKYLENLVGKKNKELNELKKNSFQNQDKIEQLQKELFQMAEQAKKIEVQARDFVKRYAPVNLDDATPIFRKAFELFQKGSLDSAQWLLRQVNFSAMVDSILREEKRINEGRKKLDEEESLAAKVKEEWAKTLQLKVDLHVTRYEYDSASKNYEELIRLDTSKVESHFSYAIFLQVIGKHEKAFEYFQRALKFANLRTEYEVLIATIKMLLSNVYLYRFDLNQAESHAKESLEALNRYYKSHPQKYEVELLVAEAQLSLGTVYFTKRDFEKAALMFSEALEMQRGLKKHDPENFPDFVIVKSLMSLGRTYMHTRDFDKAEQYFKEAEELILKKIRKKENSEEDDQFMRLKSDLGGLYWEKKNFKQAEIEYLEALRICESLVQKNQQTYQPFLFICHKTLGDFYSFQKKYEKAEIFIRNSLKVMKELVYLSEGLSKVFLAEIGDPLKNLSYNISILGDAYFKGGVYDSAEIAYKKSFELFRELAKESGGTYEPDLSTTAGTLLDLYMAVLDTLKQSVFKNQPDGFVTVEDVLYNQSKKDSIVAQKLSDYYGNRSWYLLLAFKFKEAEQTAKKGLAIRSASIWIKTNLAHSLLFQGKYQDALKVYQELKLLKNDEGKSYAAICIEDLDALEKSGVTNKDVNKIGTFLKD